VPEPKGEEILKIRTAKDWHNPYVIVDRDGFQLILRAPAQTFEGISMAELEKSLLDLPLERWPAVQESGLRNPGDNQKIASNVEDLKRMLCHYKLRVELWPSG
jgi:hypothetical protein